MSMILILITLFTQSALAESQVMELDSYKEITKIIMHETKSADKSELLIVFDLDDTVLRNFECPAVSDTSNGFWRFEESVHKCAASLTSPLVAKLIADLQTKEYPVMALTARRSLLAISTLQQLQERANFNIHFSTAPNYSQTIQEVKFLQPRKTKEPAEKIVKSIRGISFSGGANKGLALQALLKSNNNYFPKIIFIDDSKDNVRHLKQAYENSTESILIIHYTEFDRDLKK